MQGIDETRLSALEVRFRASNALNADTGIPFAYAHRELFFNEPLVERY
jgi:hypothetical protein